MTTHVSAPALEETPHVSDALRRHAESIINTRSIDPQWRNIIRYALEINDPWLPDLVRVQVKRSSTQRISPKHLILTKTI